MKKKFISSIVSMSLACFLLQTLFPQFVLAEENISIISNEMCDNIINDRTIEEVQNSIFFDFNNSIELQVDNDIQLFSLETDNTENSQQLAETWFKEKTTDIENYAFFETLSNYFSYREQDFFIQVNDDSFNEFISDNVRDDAQKRRYLTYLMQEKMNIDFLDAAVVYDVLKVEDNGENIFNLSVCEWSFYDYDDLSDEIVNIDTSGFATNHDITIIENDGIYIITADAYTEEDMNGMISSSYEYIDENVLLEESSKTTSEGFDESVSLFSNFSYSADKAVAYADTYWQSYNPNYSNYNSIGGDCANFVSQCLYAGGIPMDSGWFWYSYSNRSSSWSYCPDQRSYFSGLGTLIDNPSASQVQKGNPVWYYSSSSGRYSHAAICVGTNSAGTPIINAHNNDRYHVAWTLGNSWAKYSTVQLPSGGSNPVGCVDSCSGGSGKINIAGWAFDPDDTSQSLELHVYIGGPAESSNAEGHPGIIANVYRDDVNAVYGCGNYHGFSTSINTNKTGTQDIYIYAINVGGGENALIGSKTVNITPRVTMLDAWVSDTKMGEKVTTLNSGQMYYLCYKIYDGNSGDYFSSYSSASYTVTETVYDENRNKIHSNPYTTSDNNWIGFTPSTGGSWTGEVAITGDISGVLTISFDVEERASTIDVWVSNTAMGSKISMCTINKVEHYNCDLGKQYYLCYKMYDKNSGALFNSYTNLNYTMTLVFYDENNEEIGTRQFSNDDSDCVDFTTATAGVCSCKATISGDVSGEVTIYMYINEGVVSVTGISLNKSSIALNKGETQQLTATILPSNATNKNITWSSSNTSVATVSSSGLVTAKSVGTAVITAKTSDGSKTAICTVYVAESIVNSYPYIINSVSLKSTMGGTLSKAPTNSKFVVTANFTKVQTRNAMDSVIVALYGTDGELMYFDYIKVNYTKDKMSEVDFAIPAQSEYVEIVKVFVWDDLKRMIPLSEYFCRV